MSGPSPPVLQQPPEQQLYARWLGWGTRIGLAVLVVSFALYVSGLLPSAVPPERLPQLWGLPVAQYLQQSGAATGWGWVPQIGRGDVTALLGIVMLASCSVPALLALLPGALQRSDRLFAALCLAEVLVIVLAATGWLAGGH